MALMFRHLRELEAPLGGRLMGGSDAKFMNINTDTRRIKKGDLFLALIGNKHDGHNYIDSALAKGASAIISERSIETPLPFLLVDDTTVALGRIGALSRLGWVGQLAAITGSNGKTTVKEMLGAILGATGRTFITPANENNNLGVPLSLLKLSVKHKYAVIEIGADKQGEVSYSAALTKPNLAIITNVAKAHLGGFGSKENIAQEKGSLLKFLAADGIAILNSDDEYFLLWKTMLQGRKMFSFGLSKDADFMVKDIRHTSKGISFNLNIKEDLNSPSFQLKDKLKNTYKHLPDAENNIFIEIPVMAEHNAINAAAACAAAFAMGVDFCIMQASLKKFYPVKGRLNCLALTNNCYLIDDSYNANPDSMATALRTLAAINFDGIKRKVAVIGEMHDLGDSSITEHKNLGKLAAELKIDGLMTCGEVTANALHTFLRDNKKVTDKNRLSWCKEFNSPHEINKYLNDMNSDILEGTVFLVKASRLAKTEQVVQTIQNKLDNQ